MTRRDDEYTPTVESRANELLAEITPFHNHYKRVLKAIVDTAIADRVHYLERDLQGIMEGVAECYANDCIHAVQELRDLWNCGKETVSYYPDDCEKLIAAEYARLVDALRLKPVNYGSMLFDALRPVNPETFKQMGETL